MGEIINVFKNDGEEERTKDFTALFARLINEKENNRRLQSDDLQKEGI